MSKFKAALVGDQHFSETPPPNRTDDYLQAIFDKVTFILDYCRAKGIKNVFFLGDMFHWKVPTRNSHWLVQRLITLFLGYKDLSLHSLVGNHDFTTNISGIIRQPLWTIAQAKALVLLGVDEQGNPTQTSVKFQMGDFVAEVVGRAYIDDSPGIKGDDFQVTFDPHSTFRMALFHTTLLPDGQKFFDRFVNFAEVAPFVDANVIGCGHYHPGYDPPVQEAHGRVWVNPGAISRGTAEDHNMSRQLGFVALSFDGTNLAHKFVPIPHKPGAEVFDVEAIEKRREEKRDFTFVSALTDASTQDLDLSTTTHLMQLAKSLTKDPRVLDHVGKILQKAEEEVG